MDSAVYGILVMLLQKKSVFDFVSADAWIECVNRTVRLTFAIQTSADTKSKTDFFWTNITRMEAYNVVYALLIGVT